MLEMSSQSDSVDCFLYYDADEYTKGILSSIDKSCLKKYMSKRVHCCTSFLKHCFHGSSLNCPGIT